MDSAVLRHYFDNTVTHMVGMSLECGVESYGHGNTGTGP